MSVGNVIRLFPAFLDDAQFRDIRTYSPTAKIGMFGENYGKEGR